MGGTQFLYDQMTSVSNKINEGIWIYIYLYLTQIIFLASLMNWGPDNHFTCLTNLHILLDILLQKQYFRSKSVV